MSLFMTPGNPPSREEFPPEGQVSVIQDEAYTQAMEEIAALEKTVREQAADIIALGLRLVAKDKLITDMAGCLNDLTALFTDGKHPITTNRINVLLQRAKETVGK
jgi:hypothetical protein